MMNKKTKKGFTLIELIVAVGLLGMILIFAMVIFRVSIEAYRVAVANGEIMQKVRAITDQLNSDFGGFRNDHLNINYQIFDVDSEEIRADSIAFFANGDFQSTGQYDNPKRTILGNVAGIFYGQAADANPGIGPNIEPGTGNPREKILIRRQTILTSDSDADLNSDSNSLGEYFQKSLSELLADPSIAGFSEPNWPEWIARPELDIEDQNDLVMYMAKGVDDFTIQLEEGMAANDTITWWPTNAEVEDGITEDEYTGQLRAIKFTFTLYDSKGIIKNGKRFTHIVYIGD